LTSLSSYLVILGIIPRSAHWFKHQVYAPGAYMGYGAKPIAAVREYQALGPGK